MIAIHPLALESSMYAGVADGLGKLGLRTLAVDLPGFGQTPTTVGRLTPAVLSQPVIELARSLERPPILLGMSLGGRVAIEAALRAPESVRGLVLVAPYLPWRTRRRMIALAHHIDPVWGELLPIEHAWPLLKALTTGLESISALEHDWFARACVRVAYYSSCPATRTAFLSAARELALDPAFGEQGLWPRLPRLTMPVSFLWAGRDRLIPSSHARDTARVLPESSHLEAGCSGHFVNFVHSRCMEHAMALATSRMLDIEEQGVRPPSPALAPCLAYPGEQAEEAEPDAHAGPSTSRLARRIMLRS